METNDTSIRETLSGGRGVRDSPHRVTSLIETETSNGQESGVRKGDRGSAKNEAGLGKKQVIRKSDLYPKRISVQIGNEYNEGCHTLANELQDQRIDKSERITRDTVIRCFVAVGLMTFRLEEYENVDNEKELLELMLSKRLAA